MFNKILLGRNFLTKFNGSLEDVVICSMQSSLEELRPVSFCSSQEPSAKAMHRHAYRQSCFKCCVKQISPAARLTCNAAIETIHFVKGFWARDVSRFELLLQLTTQSSVYHYDSHFGQSQYLSGIFISVNWMTSASFSPV